MSPKWFRFGEETVPKKEMLRRKRNETKTEHLKQDLPFQKILWPLKSESAKSERKTLVT